MLGDSVNFIDPLGLYDYNSLSLSDNKRVNPYLAFVQNIILLGHAALYNSDNAYTVINHGYRGYSELNLDKIAREAKQSGKNYIELSICEIGQGDIPQKLHNLSGLPIKFSEDYVRPPAYGIGGPSLSDSATATTHGWRWIR